jgi:hypothetical protein
MTETVTAPEATEATEATEAEAKAPVSTKDKITKALGKDLSTTTHPAFIQWVKDEADVDLDPTSVLATQSLYNVFRKTDTFAKAKDSLPKGTSTAEVAMPTTPEEAKAALEKHQKDAERRKQAQVKADERAAKIQELLASMAGGESGEPADEAPEVAEPDEDMQEAF